MVLEKITQAAKREKGYEKLPGIAQVALVLSEIEEARALSIPLAAIQQAMEAAGSSVSLRYLRQALAVARARALKRQKHLNIPTSTSALSASVEMPPALAEQPQRTEADQPPRSAKREREEKADRYVDSPNNNAIFRRHAKKP
ncbi:hypothetical protein [Pseudomonas fluorescens]|uniref:hypothetical protein n=1 Tax=Pseudomonas fluorescens TaxID=294 RepID=UPI001241FD1A|nr:hypothetical protein [Pseudomonas fluorescens]